MGDLSGSREPNPQAVSALSGFDPGRYTESTLVPPSIAGLLGEIARIADDYDLRAAIDECGPTSIADSFIWRDCIELAAAIAIETRRAETGNTDSVAER